MFSRKTQVRSSAVTNHAILGFEQLEQRIAPARYTWRGVDGQTWATVTAWKVWEQHFISGEWGWEAADAAPSALDDVEFFGVTRAFGPNGTADCAITTTTDVQSIKIEQSYTGTIKLGNTLTASNFVKMYGGTVGRLTAGATGQPILTIPDDSLMLWHGGRLDDMYLHVESGGLITVDNTDVDLPLLMRKAKITLHGELNWKQGNVGVAGGASEASQIR